MAVACSGNFSEFVHHTRHHRHHNRTMILKEYRLSVGNQNPVTLYMLSLSSLQKPCTSTRYRVPYVIKQVVLAQTLEGYRANKWQAGEAHKTLLSYHNVSESALHLHTCLRSYRRLYPLDKSSEYNSSSKHHYVRLHQPRQLRKCRYHMESYASNE
jgi:hypothetical protein